MGVRILRGKYDTDGDYACMVDSVTDVVFGPLLNGEDANDFLESLDEDPRKMLSDELISLYHNWRTENH